MMWQCFMSLSAAEINRLVKRDPWGIPDIAIIKPTASSTEVTAK